MEVCVALEQGVKCGGGGERKKKVRWGEKSGCVYIVDEIPKGEESFRYAPNIEHEPILKEEKEKKGKK